MRDLVCASGCGRVLGWVTTSGHITITGNAVKTGHDDVALALFVCFPCWASLFPDEAPRLEATLKVAAEHRAMLATIRERRHERRARALRVRSTCHARGTR